MSTPFTEIYRIFNGRLTDNEQTKFDSNNKRKILLENAIPDYESYICELDIDFNTEIINQDLKRKEKKLLSLLMLREYYRLEKVKWSKITNIVTDSTKLTSTGDVKKSLQQNLDEIEEEINNLLSTLI